jgi:hypothetical protein
MPSNKGTRKIITNMTRGGKEIIRQGYETQKLAGFSRLSHENLEN